MLKCPANRSRTTLARFGAAGSLWLEVGMLINVNGQSYSKWEDVPEDVRKELAGSMPDAGHNGVPDVFDGNLGGLGTVAESGQPTTFTAISVDGQQVSSLDQL